MQFKFNKKKYIVTRPNIIPLVGFIFALTTLLSLSAWQFKRLEWKTGLINERVSRFESKTTSLESIEMPSEFEFQRVKVTGVLLNEYELFMPALSKNGNNGYHILTILKSSNLGNIIYDTGWIPLKKREKNERINNLMSGEKEFEAVIRIPGRKGRFQPDNDVTGNFWFFVDPIQIQNFTKLKLEGTFYLESVNNGPNGYPLGNQTRIYIRNNHLQYALTWLMIAMGLIGVFFAANIKRVKK